MTVKGNTIKDAFYREAAELWGFSRDEVIAILKEYAKSFKEEDIAEYRLILQNKFLKRSELHARIPEHVRQYSEVPCPICGARTVGDTTLFGRYTRTPGWICDNGGRKHFIWWKVNRIRGYQGLPPIDFMNIDWEKYKLHSQTI